MPLATLAMILSCRIFLIASSLAFSSTGRFLYTKVPKSALSLVPVSLLLLEERCDETSSVVDMLPPGVSFCCWIMVLAFST